MFGHLKGIIAGILFIMIATLLMQLLFILVAVAYNHIANDYPFLKEFKWIFKYLLGIPAFVSIMFYGGYITTFIAKSKPILNSIIVGLIVMISMMWSALLNAELTITGAVISIVVIIAIVLGGLFAEKKLKTLSSV